MEIAEWAAPIIPVLKRDKNAVRICGDFRLTVNPASKLDSYPMIPKVEDLFARLRGGKYFTKLDLSQAYQQLRLEEDSKRYVVINTHRVYTVTLRNLLSSWDLSESHREHTTRHRWSGCVSRRYTRDREYGDGTSENAVGSTGSIRQRGLRVKRSKCEFINPSVSYLGHKIDANGLHPLQDKVEAITEAPTPCSVQELRSYLGILTYYGKFLQNLSTTLCPLYDLLKKDVPWIWGKAQVKAFSASKDLFTSSKFLAHYDSTQRLTLACDASGYGLGAVLAHNMPDGSDRPISYASRTLTKSEQNYSQLEKEALSCIFGIKKFHDYVFGHPFKLVTDHKPLLGLLKEDHARCLST